MQIITKHWQKNPILAIFIIIATMGFQAYAYQNLTNKKSQANYQYPFELSTSKSSIGTLSKEITFYQKRIQQHPEDGLDRAILAKTYLKMARTSGDNKWYTLAEKSAKESLAKLPFDNHNALLVLAKVAEARHDFAETIRLSNKSLQIKPDNQDALAMLATTNLAKGEVKTASIFANKLVDKIPTLNSFLLRALINLAQGKDKAAIEDFQSAIASEEPGEIATSAKVRALLGRFYLSRGKYDRAKQLFEEALRILPQYPFALVNLAVLETELGNYQGAEKYYAQVVSLSTEKGDKNQIHTFDRTALIGIAQVKKLQGDISAAEKYWNRAEKSFREHSHNSDNPKGIDRMDNTIVSTYRGHKHNFNHTHDHKHDHKHKQNFGHQRDLAKLLLLRGHSQDLPEALSLMKAEVKIRRDAETLDTLAQILYRLQHPRKAKNIYQEILNTGIKDAKIFYRAGIIEKQLGNSEQAKTYFQQALRVNLNIERSHSLGFLTLP
ncbi:MAG: tetratricopeptide repeat protein [Cyanobacteria bacterium P01_A01_bin.84]